MGNKDCELLSPGAAASRSIPRPVGYGFLQLSVCTDSETMPVFYLLYIVRKSYS